MRLLIGWWGERARSAGINPGRLLGAFLLVVLSACSGGGGGGGSSGGAAAVVAPAISTQPQATRVNDGQTATFSVSAVSATTPTYQWSRNGAAIAGATGASYSVSPAQLSDNGAAFSVAVTNAGGTTQSASATLSVATVAPGITGNAPTTVSVVAGQSATFSVVATGSSPLTFQWRRGGTAIAGATTSSYTTPPTGAADNGATFDVVVTNAAGSFTSALFTLVVTGLPQAPSIMAQPQSVSARVGNPATFSVTASGTAPFSYQWLRGGVPIAGAQSATYTLTTALADNGAQFSVVVTNAAGSVTSAAATLTVTPQPGIALVAGNIGGAGTIDGTGVTARFAAPSASAIDNAGNVLVADGGLVRKLATNGMVTTLAGSPSLRGAADGTGSAATFGAAVGIAVDATGNAYVADSTNDTVRKVTPMGVVTTLAGTSGTAGSTDGTGTSASFNAPNGVATDAAGNVFVADTGNHTIRRITPSGVVTTVAGTAGMAGSMDGVGTAASFSQPAALVVDAASNLYVADLGNATIRRITPAGVVSTIAGTAGARGAVDATGAAARFNAPYGIAIDGSGNLYVGDAGAATIRKIGAGAVVTTLAGTAGVIGGADGTGAAASFSAVVGVASNASGLLYVADRDNDEIRTVSTTGVVATAAGARRIAGGADGVGSAATFTTPDSIAVDPSGNLYVSDAGNATIRKITSGGSVSTLAGVAGAFGSVDGTASQARLGIIRGIAVAANGTVYAVEFDNGTVRMISPSGTVTTIAGNATGGGGSADGTGSAASFNGPSGVAVDSAGNLFVTDSLNATIRKVTPAGVVTTFAGTAGRSGSADGVGAAASFSLPTAISIDTAGNLFVTDPGNNTVRRITPAGVVTTIGGIAGQTGATDGPGATSLFNGPIGIAVDRAGNRYVVDTGNAVIRRIDSAGTVSTVAGIADGRRGVRLGALPGALSRPLHVAVDSNGVLYVTDATAVLVVSLP